MTELVNQTMDNFAVKGTCDFHEEFAVPLPCTVFLRLMGLPLEDLDIFLAMKDEIIRPPGDTMEEQAPTRKKTAENIYAYFEETLEKRRGAPPPRTCWAGSCGPRSTGCGSPTRRSSTSASSSSSPGSTR